MASMQYADAVATGCRCISAHSQRILTSDASDKWYHAVGMDELAIRRDTTATLRRAILARFAPGPERQAWLRWVAGRAKSRAAMSRHIVVPSTGRATRCKQQSDT
jgi:hypothetical protein